MDAALWELLDEGESEDEVAAIIRLSRPGVAPPGVRLVAEFGHIATCRLKRRDILPTREAKTVGSLKAGRVHGPEPEPDDELLEGIPESLTFVDERRPPGESATGRGCVIGVVDWGCDFAHPDFRNPEGKTRLLALWDQRAQKDRKAPAPYGYGVVHMREAINHALTTSDPYATLNYHPADADTGQGAHGTHVLGIAAGNGRGGCPPGIAPEADLVFVHSATLAREGPDRLGDSVTLLEAIDFIKRVAGDRPWVINLSMGRHGEPHDGTTLVEQGLDQVLRAAPGRAIVQSTGNYFDRRIHSSGQLRPSEQRQLVWIVEEIDPTPNQLEVWYSGLDTFDVEVVGPDECLQQSAALDEQAAFIVKGIEVGKIYHRRAEPNNLSNHVEIFLHRGAPNGRWIVTLKGKEVLDGRYHAWIERDAACPRCQSTFSVDDAVSTSTTGTICNGFRTIAVGAYNLHSPEHELAPFSSSGPTRDGRLKPDLVAPGVRVLAARSAPREPDDETPLVTRMSGTSMAAPYVAGTVALMFEVAGRPLRIEETHNLLLASTTKPALIGENMARIGSGYCEISKAVAAARSVNRSLTAQRGESKSEQIMETEFDETYGELREDEPAERDTKRNFILISGGPGPYNTRDIEHDKSWANYVTPPLLMTDTKKKLAAFSATDEEIWWFVYKPAYVTRWSDDAKSKTAAREKEVERVKKLGFSSYVELIKKRARDRGWNLRWLSEADDLWEKLKSFSKGSISRVWYWGHAREDLWLTVAHDPGTDVAIAPAADEIITVSSIDPALKDRFQTGNLSRIHRFVGCNTEDFAEAWSKAFGVWSEGVVDKVNFSSIHSTGGEPCLSGSARVKYFDTSGSYDSTEDLRTQAKKCSDLPQEIFPTECTLEEDEVFINQPELVCRESSGIGDVYSSDEAWLGEQYESDEAFTDQITVEGESCPPFEMQLLESADEVVRSQNGLRVSPGSMLSETIRRVKGSNAPLSEQLGMPASPSVIFEAFALGKECEATREQIDQLFEVVALPRTRLAETHPGDILFRHSLGDGSFTHAAILTTGEALKQENLSSLGIIPESTRSGYYFEVVEGGRYPHHQSDRFARRLTDDSGLLTHDSLVLRIRHHGPRLPEDLERWDETGGPTVPPLRTRLDGIDIYQSNTGFPSFSRIAQAGFSFVFHKASQFIADTEFAKRWPQIAAAGMLRGAYHFFSHRAGTVPEQVERFASTVRRLVPGDLGPAIDLEDRDPARRADFWVPRIQQFADLLEARLGRLPIFYTSRSYWRDFAGNDLGFGHYPLWVVWVNPGEPPLPAGWTRWHFWQWHFEESTTPMPAPFSHSDRGVDLNRFNGTIYQLRGMADLGATAPHLVGNQECIAHTEVDGRIHLSEYVNGSWIDQDLFNQVRSTNISGTLPLAAGDPAATALGSEQVIVYRSINGGVHAITRTLTAADSSWHAVDITGGGGRAVGDPFVFIFQNNIHVIYWDQFDDHVHVVRVNAVWQGESLSDRPSPSAPSQISGIGTGYEYQNRLHVVSRSRNDGHLFDLTAPARSALPLNLTATAHVRGGQLPAATYRPTTYTLAGKAPRIVFRAVRGDIWQIERDTLNAMNLSRDAGNAPKAAGSPTAVVSDRAHIFYRTLDGNIIDIFDDAGVWRRRNVCAEAAADPRAFVDSRGGAAVTFRAIDGTIRIARFVNGAWRCENVVARSQTASRVESEADTDSIGDISYELAQLSRPLQDSGPTWSGAETFEEQISVDDVADEMNGLRCQFLSDYRATRADSTARTFANGALVPIENWNGVGNEATIAGFSVPKLVLAPAPQSVSGVRRYDVGLGPQRAAVIRNSEELSNWVAREGEYRRNHSTWERERVRLEDLLARRQRTYSRMWVQQMMYNRFDLPIALWVRHYNTQLSPATRLDPNIVKSILYQESRLGTSGQHLMPPPSDWSSGPRHPIRSRYNIGQAIDSWGPQQFLMIREMAPAIYTRHGLSALDGTWFSMSNNDYAAHPSFMRALREFFEFRDANNNNLMGTPNRDLHEDYDFWIRTCVRWLFVKYTNLTTPSWAEAVRAYNGGGARARAYRTAVMARVGSTDPFTAESVDSTTDGVAAEDGASIGHGVLQENAPQLDSSATLTWEDITRVTDSRGNLQVFYVVTGAPASVASIGDEGKAIFHLRVRNTNTVYNHKDVSTRYRVLDVLPNRQFREVMPWRRFSGPDLEDESSRVIKLSLESQTLLEAYNPESPLTRLEVEYHWRETWEDAQEHYNRTGLDFMLVAPIEYLLSRKQRLTQRDIELNDPVHKADYWIPVTGVNFSADIRQPVTIQLDIMSSVTSSGTGQQTTSSGQTRSTTRTSTTSNTFSVQLNGEVSQGGSAKASIEVLELGVQQMFKLGASLGYSHTRTDTSSTTVAREFTRSLMMSRTYAASQAVTTRTTLTVSPPEVQQPRGTGSGSEPRVPGAGIGSVGVYLYPLVAFFEVPYVRFEGVNRMGQATRRSEGRVAVPFVTEWRLTSHRGG